MASSLAGLSLRDLEYLEAIAEHRHFGRAAEACGVSQPALSIQVRKLEALLDATIFERTPRGVIMTPQGSRILTLSRVVLREARVLLASRLTAEDEPAGPLRVGALPTLGPYLLPQVIRPLRARFPKLRFVLSEDRSEKLAEQLISGEIDAALACNTGEGGAVAHDSLFFEPFVLVHPAEHHAAAIGEAPDDPPVLIIEEGHCLHDQLRSTCSPAFRGASRRASSLEMLRQMVAAGEGVSLMPVLAALSFERGDGLTAYRGLNDPLAGREVVLSWRRSDTRAGWFSVIAGTIRRAIAGQPVRMIELVGEDAQDMAADQGRPCMPGVP
jgi:LysR family hydrogen peroxide-inducible transcriptional activator